MKAIELRPGIACRIDGKLCVVVKYTHRTPGNLRAFCQVKMKEIATGTHFERRLNPADEIEATTLDRRMAEYLYDEGDGYVFMDSESFDQFTLPKDDVEEQMLYLKPNSSTTILFHEEKPILIELPSAVELAVAETQPGIKGATATNQLKEAILETGLKTRVPPFIDVGEIVRVSTEDGSYMSRAKES